MGLPEGELAQSEKTRLFIAESVWPENPLAIPNGTL